MAAVRTGAAFGAANETTEELGGVQGFILRTATESGLPGRNPIPLLLPAEGGKLGCSIRIWKNSTRDIAEMQIREWVSDR